MKRWFKTVTVVPDQSPELQLMLVEFFKTTKILIDMWQCAMVWNLRIRHPREIFATKDDRYNMQFWYEQDTSDFKIWWRNDECPATNPTSQWTFWGLQIRKWNYPASCHSFSTAILRVWESNNFDYANCLMAFVEYLGQLWNAATQQCSFILQLPWTTPYCCTWNFGQKSILHRTEKW